VTVFDVSITLAVTEGLLLVVLTQCGAGHRINRLGLVVVDIVVHARVGLGVERRSHRARGAGTPAARDLDIGALRI